jgi:hypothetical protein
MAKKIFRLLFNTFLSVTKGNFKLALDLASFTDNALFAAKADAAILILYNFFHPLFTTYQTLYNAMKVQKDTAEGGTLTLKQSLKGMTDKVNIWDTAILNFYGGLKTNPSYKAIFTDGHTPFLRGSQKSRIDAVKQLSDKLIGIVGLAATKTDVDSYYATLNNAFTTHSGQKSTKGTNSSAVEAQRLEVCYGLQYVLGGLMQKYYKDLKQAANFFDMAKLQSAEQNKFTKKVLKGMTLYNIFERTVVPGTQISIWNKGAGPLQFCFAKNATDGIGTMFITIAPGANETHNADEFGDIANNHFFLVNNPVDIVGSYVVELL